MLSYMIGGDKIHRKRGTKKSGIFSVEPVVDHSIVEVELATAPDKQNL